MLKKILAGAITILALVAPAQAVTFDSGVGDVEQFTQIVTATGNRTYTYSFDNLASGLFSVIGAITGNNFNITSASLNGTALDIFRPSAQQSLASIDYTGTMPITLSITGTKVGNGAGLLSGNLLVVSAVPEPESIAMMIAGLVVIAAVVRRRSRSGTQTAPVTG